MSYPKWIFAITTGTAFTFSTCGLAQLRVDTKGNVPNGAAEAERDVPRGKALGTKNETPKGKALGAERREARRPAAEDQLAPATNAAAAAPMTFRSTKLIGTPVTDNTGAPVGKIMDFVTDQQGNLLYPVISYTAAPGFSSKLFAIPSQALSFQTGETHETQAQLTFDPQLLQKAPNFSSTQFPNFSDAAFMNQFTTFWSNVLPLNNSVVGNSRTPVSTGRGLPEMRTSGAAATRGAAGTVTPATPGTSVTGTAGVATAPTTPSSSARTTAQGST